MLSHGGLLDGQSTAHALLPDLGCALAVYTNQEERILTKGLRNALLDLVMGVTTTDWVRVTRGLIATQEADAIKTMGGGPPTAPPGGPSLPLPAYQGRYRDPWFGGATVNVAGGRLALRFEKAPAAASALEAWGPDAFRTRFTNGWEDAVLTFAIAEGKVTGITARPVSPLADFSYDYQDLAFKREG